MKKYSLIPGYVKHLTLATGILLTSATILPTAANADQRNMDHHCGGGMHGLFRGLDLSADQKASLKKVFEAHKTALMADRTAVKTARVALEKYLASGGSDTAQVASLTTTTATSSQALQNEFASAFIEGYGILTDDQKASLKAMPESAFAFGKGDGGKFGHGWRHDANGETNSDVNE